MSGTRQQEVSFGINKPGGSLLPDIDPRLLSVLEMLTVKHTSRYDPAVAQRLEKLEARLAVTTLAEIEIQMNQDELAFAIPQAFDYYLTLDPRRIAGEWDASLLGSYLGRLDAIDENMFYEYYRRFLFSSPEIPDFAGNLGILTENAEYIYTGGNVYLIRIPGESLDAYLQAVNITDLSLGELLVHAAVEKGKISHAEIQSKINGRNFTASISLDGERANLDRIGAAIEIDGFTVTGTLLSDVRNPDRLVSVLELRADNLALEWDIFWDKVSGIDNLKLQIKASAPLGSLELYAAGNLYVNNPVGYIDANIKNASLSLEIPFGDLDVSLNGRYMLKADAEPILFAGERMPLSGFNELDLLMAFGRLAGHPQLGDLITGFIF
jgi:hypothetical protein